MLLKRLLKRAVVVAALLWGAFAWYTGRIDPAAGTARVYSVVAEKLGRNKTKASAEVLPQDAAAARALATAKAAGLEPGKKPVVDGLVAKGAHSANDVLCLAHAVYYEAGKESRDIQTAVAQVAINRTSAIPGVKTICRIVYLGLGRPMGCMFAATCRNLGTIPDDEARWRAALEVAQDVAAGKGLLPQYEQATHFNASQIRPRWVSSVYQIGDKTGRFTFYSQSPVELPVEASAAGASPLKRAAAALAADENNAVAARRKAANLPRLARQASPGAMGLGASTGGAGPSGGAAASGSSAASRSEPRAKPEPRAAAPQRSPFGDGFN